MKTKEAFPTYFFLIPGATTFTTFVQASSSMYDALFVTTQDPYGNPYLVTKLLPISLGFTCVFFGKDITGAIHTRCTPNPKGLLLKTLIH